MWLSRAVPHLYVYHHTHTCNANITILRMRRASSHVQSKPTTTCWLTWKSCRCCYLVSSSRSMYPRERCVWSSCSPTCMPGILSASHCQKSTLRCFSGIEKYTKKKKNRYFIVRSCEKSKQQTWRVWVCCARIFFPLIIYVILNAYKDNSYFMLR